MPVAIVRTANPNGVAASSNVATYSSINIGKADVSRIIVVLVGTELSSSTPSGCTIDYGSGDTAMTPCTGANQGISYSQAYYLKVPTGTSATIKVTYSATNPATTGNHIAVYKVTGAKVSSTGGNNSTDMDSTAPLTTGSITIPSGGGFLALASCGADTQSKTWANATEDLDDDVGTFRFCTAYSLTPQTATITCTGTGNGEDGALSWIIFAEDVAPTVSLSSPADAGTISDTTPDLVFTGTDTESNDIRYRLQIDTDNTFPLVLGGCLDFDGVDDYARRANASTVTDNFTVSLWLYIDAYGAGTTRFFNNGVTDARGYALQISSAGVLSADYSFVATVSSGYTLSTGVWYHIVLVRDNGVSRFFVDAVQRGDQNTSSPNAAGSGDYLTLGASTTSTPTTSSFCNCKLDDVRLYERALSMDEIYTLFANGTMYSSSDISNTSLKAQWKCDDGSGTSVADATATGWTLTTSGSPTWGTGIVPTGSNIDRDLISGTDAGFSGSPDNSDPFASGQAVTHTIQSALAAATYYWRVRGLDATGSNRWGAWSSTRSFVLSNVTTNTKTVSAKARIKNTTTRTVTAKGRIKGLGVTKTISSKARIKKTANTKTISVKARIKKTVTQTVSAKGRIKGLGVTKTVQAKSRIKQLSLTKTVSAKARVKLNITKTISAKSRIKGLGVTKTITTKSRIKKNITQTVSAKVKITPNITVLTKTVQAKARVKVLNNTKTVTSKARVRSTGNIKTVSARARIRVLNNTKTVSSKARIKKSSITNTVGAKSRVKKVVDRTVSVKSRIKNTTTKTVSSKSRIKNYTTRTVSAKGRIGSTGSSQTVTSKARIKILAVTKTISAKARIKTSVRRVNFILNPSFETNLTNWYGNNSDGALDSAYTRITAGTIRTFFGGCAMKFNGTNRNVAAFSNKIYVEAGQAYTLSAYIYKVTGFTGNATIDILEYDVNNNLIVDGTNTSNISGFNAFERVSVTQTMNASTSYVRIRFVNDSNATGTAYIDAVLFEKSSVLNDYLDGTTQNSAWVGTAHGSISYQNAIYSNSKARIKLSGVYRRRNLMTNPSIENDTGTSPAGSTDFAYAGSKSSKCSRTFVSGSQTAQSYFNTTTAFKPTIGKTYMFSAWVYYPVGTPLDAIGIDVRGFNSWARKGSRGSFSPVGGVWTRVYLPSAITADENDAREGWRLIIADPTLQAGQSTYTGTAYYYIDAILIEETDTVNTYFDGTSAGASWLGTANASASDLALSTNIQAKARIKNYTTKTVQAKSRIRSTGNITTVTARARIKNTVGKTISVKTRIKKLAVTKTISVKARIVGTKEKTITAGARIKNLYSSIVSAKARILSTGITTSISTKARIRVVDNTNTISVKSRIKQVINVTISACARILATHVQTVSAKAKIRNILQPSIVRMLFRLSQVNFNNHKADTNKSLTNMQKTKMTKTK